MLNRGTCSWITFSGGLPLLLLIVWQSKCLGLGVGFKPLSVLISVCGELSLSLHATMTLANGGEKQRKDTWRISNQSGLSCKQKEVVGTSPPPPFKLTYCHITLQFQSSFSFTGTQFCKKQRASLATLIFYSIFPFDSLTSKFIIWMLVHPWIPFHTKCNSWHCIFLTLVKHWYGS